MTQPNFNTKHSLACPFLLHSHFCFGRVVSTHVATKKRGAEAAQL